jgi:ABC-type transport system involved in cytochrome bd biosynthesis fused ATPase/permease subunit
MLARALCTVCLNGVFSFLAALSLAGLLRALTEAGTPLGLASLLPTIGWTYAAWLSLNHVFVHAQTVGVAARAVAEWRALVLLGGETVPQSSVASFVDRECGRIENAWGGGVMVVLAACTLVVSAAFFLLALGPGGAVSLVVMAASSWALWALAGRLSTHYESLSEASRQRVSLTSFVVRARRMVVLNGWAGLLSDEHRADRIGEERPLRDIARLVAAINALSSMTPIVALMGAACAQLLSSGRVSVPSLLAGIAVIGGLRSVANGIPDAIANLTQGRIAHRALDAALRGEEEKVAPRQPVLPVPHAMHVAIIGATASGKSTVLLAAANAHGARRPVFVPSEPTGFSGTARDYLTTLQPCASEEAILSALALVRLGPAILQSGTDDRQLGATDRGVSRGQAKRLELARALLSGADAVYLDQPTMGLDGETRQGLLRALLEGPWQNTPVFFVTDNDDEAQTAGERWTVADWHVASVRDDGRRRANSREGCSAPGAVDDAASLVPDAVPVNPGRGQGVLARLIRGGFGPAAALAACLLSLKEALAIGGDYLLTAGGWTASPGMTAMRVFALMLATTLVAIVASLGTFHLVIRRASALCQRFFEHLMAIASAPARYDDPLGRATRDQRRIDEMFPSLLVETWGAAAMLLANVGYVAVVAPRVALWSLPLASLLFAANVVHRKRLLATNALDVARSGRFLQNLDELAGSLPRLGAPQRIAVARGWIGASMQRRALTAYQNIEEQRRFGYRIDLLGMGWFFAVLLAVRSTGTGASLALALSLTYSLIAIFGRTSRTFLQLDQLLESSDRLLVPGASVVESTTVGAAPDLRFRAVSFWRDGGAAPVIRLLDATVGAGSLALVVGPSGTGKSTMAALVLGDLRASEGEVLLGDKPMPAPGASADLVQSFDAVPLFRPGPLHLHFGIPEASSPALAGAVGMLGLEDVLAALPGAAAFEVPRSGEVPLGRSAAQRLALLRLLTCPARIAVLDEATSELGQADERAFLTRLRTAIPQTTMMVITHNESLRPLANTVMRFEGDGVVSVST